MDKIFTFLSVVLLVLGFIFSLFFFRFGVLIIVAAFVFVFFMLMFKKGFSK